MTFLCVELSLRRRGCDVRPQSTPASRRVGVGAMCGPRVSKRADDVLYCLAMYGHQQASFSKRMMCCTVSQFPNDVLYCLAVSKWCVILSRSFKIISSAEISLSRTSSELYFMNWSIYCIRKITCKLPNSSKFCFKNLNWSLVCQLCQHTKTK